MLCMANGAEKYRLCHVTIILTLIPKGFDYHFKLSILRRPGLRPLLLFRDNNTSGYLCPFELIEDHPQYIP